MVFLGLAPGGLDAMLRHHETTEIASAGLHRLVSQPVTTEAIHTWERALKPRQVAFAESVLGGWMDRHGYERAASGRPVPERLVRRHRKRRREMRVAAAKRQARKLGLRLTYRRPVAALPPPGSANR